MRSIWVISFEAGKILGGIGLSSVQLKFYLEWPQDWRRKKLQASILSVTVGLAALVGLVYLIDRNFTSEALTKCITRTWRTCSLIAAIQITLRSGQNKR